MSEPTTKCRRNDEGDWLTPRGEPCNESHCPMCGDRRARDLPWDTYVCGECVGKIRADMREAENLSTLLLAEALIKGVTSEAAHLAGPNTDPTLWTWRRINQRRTTGDAETWDTRHPGVCFGMWERELREDFGHDDEILSSPTLAQARSYLDTIVSVMAGSEDHVLVLAELADDMRDLRRHLEGVLREGEQVDRGAPCLRCHVPLRRKWTGRTENEDHWHCPRCREESTHAQYMFAVSAAAQEERERAAKSQQCG